MGAYTKNVPGVPGISRTFATEVMCHPTLLNRADGALGAGCARFQLNLGQILERGPGSIDEWLHRDEGVWSDVPKLHPELELASVIALVDFTADNGATRVVPGSHRWSDRLATMDQQVNPTPDQIAVAEMSAGSAVVYTGGLIHGGGANRSLDDPSLITVHHQAESFEALHSFLADPQLQIVMKEAGVTTEPEVTFHTGGWVTTY